MAPMKRKGAFAGRAAKRSRHSKLVPTVVDALADADVLPANFRSLLKHSLPIVLNVNKVDRHAFEAEVVDQAQRALTQAQAALEQKHAAAFEHQKETIAPAELTRRSKAKEAAEAHLEATKGNLEASKSAKKAAEKAVQDAENTLKEAQKVEKVADKELQRRVDKKVNLESSLANEFVMLKDGTSAAAAGKKAVQKLLAHGKEFGVDSTLMHTLPIACKKTPESRTEFESMVFTNLQAAIVNQISVLAQKVAEQEPVKAGAAATTAGAKDALEKAQAALTEATDALTAAQTAHRDANKDVGKADHVLRHIWEDMRKACEAQDSLANDVKNFKENIWAAFNQLKEKEPEPEPVEEPVPEEAAPVEAAPVEAAVEAAPTEAVAPA